MQAPSHPTSTSNTTPGVASSAPAASAPTSLPMGRGALLQQQRLLAQQQQAAAAQDAPPAATPPLQPAAAPAPAGQYPGMEFSCSPKLPCFLPGYHVYTSSSPTCY